jgi:glycosyltransferase involved in cell wall biosynthesis
MVQGSDVFHLHAPDRRRVILECCRKVRGIVCVSRQLADTLINAGVEPGKVHVVPNGVDTDLFRYRAQEEAKRKLSAIGGQPWAREDRKPATGDSGRPQKRVLYVGNLVTVKGLDVLLNAWRLLQTAADRQTASVVLQIVGSGPLRGKLERRARALGIADSVHFVGPRPHPEIPLWMNAADCLCLSSRSEGMPNVVLEALVSGLPLVVSDVGNCRELLNGEPMARVVPAGDAEAMAQGLREVLTFTGARSEMAERHRNRLSWRHQAGVILGLIRAETANTAG